MKAVRPFVTLAAIAALAACQQGPAANEVAAAPAPDTNTAETVVREEVRPTPVATAAAIRTQPGPERNTVSLNRVAVTGDILTVTMTFSGGSCCVRFDLDEVSVIDDATSQRLSVLRDDSGRYMASPLGGSDNSIRIRSFTNPSVVWFKFPAPPATSPTVSITLPGVAPFDAVPVTR